MRYVIGIEGGGTKSQGVALSLDGKILKKAQGPGTNLQTLEEKELRERLMALVAKLKLKDKPVGICVGLAGCDREQDKKKLKGILKSSFPGTPCMAESDARIGLFAAFEKSPGILLIAGTGSVAIGQDGKGRIHRAGGWGYLLGDEGSGYALGREAIRTCLSGRKTRMAALIKRSLGLKEMEAIIPWVYYRKDAPREIAMLAQVVFEAARKKDPAALEIVGNGASALCDLVFDLAEQLGLGQPRIAFGGGLLSHPTPLRQRLVELLGKKVQIVQPLHLVPLGAALMGVQRLNG